MEFTEEEKLVLTVAIQNLYNLVNILKDNNQEIYSYGDGEINGDTIYSIADKLEIEL